MAILIEQAVFTSGFGSVVNAYHTAQSFTLSSPAQVSKVSVYGASEVGGTIDIILRSVVGGVVQSDTLAQVLSISPSDGLSWCDVTFSSPVALASGVYVIDVIPHGTDFNWAVNESDIYSGGKFYLYDGTWSEFAGGTYDGAFRVYSEAAAPSLPTSIDGVTELGDADDGSADGKLTLSADMEVISGGDLTLSVAQVSDLAGDKSISVQPGGKLKVGAGRKITVVPGTKYNLNT